MSREHVPSSLLVEMIVVIGWLVPYNSYDVRKLLASVLAAAGLFTAGVEELLQSLQILFFMV